MIENFEHAIRFLFWAEDYISDNQKDPGGLTIWGICKRDHPAVVEMLSKMPKENAKRYAAEFYQVNYWDAIGGDSLPDLLDIVLFDISVNQGIGGAKEIQKAAYDWRDAIILRSDKYDDLKLYGEFGRGWNKKRVVALRDYIASNFRVLEWDRKELIKAER